MGRVDMMVRIALATVLFSSNTLLQNSEHQWIAVTGFLPLMTGIFRFCPLYDLLGIRTCSPVHEEPRLRVTNSKAL